LTISLTMLLLPDNYQSSSVAMTIEQRSPYSDRDFLILLNGLLLQRDFCPPMARGHSLS